MKCPDVVFQAGLAENTATENDVTEKFWALLVTKNGDRQSVSGVEAGIF